MVEAILWWLNHLFKVVMAFGTLWLVFEEGRRTWRKSPVRTIRDEDDRRRRDGRTWSADDVKCIAETKNPDGTLKALLVLLDGEEYWVPFSVVHDDSDVYGKGHTGKLVVAFWWAKSRELVEDDDS